MLYFIIALNYKIQYNICIIIIDGDSYLYQWFLCQVHFCCNCRIDISFYIAVMYFLFLRGKWWKLTGNMLYGFNILSTPSALITSQYVIDFVFNVICCHILLLGSTEYSLRFRIWIPLRIHKYLCNTPVLFTASLSVYPCIHLSIKPFAGSYMSECS